MPIRNYNSKVLVVALCLSLPLVLITVIPAQARQQDPAMEDRLLQAVKSEPVYLTGIFQTFSDMNLANDFFEGGDSFHIGTARLGLGGRLDHHFNWRVQFRLESEPNLLDAWISWTAHELLSIRAGAQKPQISAEQIHSSGVTEFVRRARFVSSQLNSRDIGISVYGERGLFGYNLAMFNGEGVRANQDNRFLYLARGYYHRPLEQGRAELGANIMSGGCYSAECSPSSLASAGRRTTLGADLRLETSKWLFSAELLTTHAQLDPVVAAEERVTGSHLTGGITVTEGVRLLARWDWLHYREADSETHLLVAGYDHYFGRLIRLQLNLLAELEAGQSAAAGVTGNLQLRF